jgi:hypothetical protein
MALMPRIQGPKEYKISPDFLKRGLTGCAQFSGRKVKLVSSQVTEIKRRQTDAFRPGTKGCVVEL